jgi:hypothetical protein
MCVTCYRTIDELQGHAPDTSPENWGTNSPLPPDAWSVRFVKYSGVLSDAVDEGLSALGESPKEAIYEVLKTDFSMRKTDIPRRFAEFSSILKENIGPGATPLLEFIVDRFTQGLHIESLSSIDLDESIKRVDRILNGDLPLSNRGDDPSHTVSVLPSDKTVDDSYGSIQLTHSPPSFSCANRSIAISTASQETDKKIPGRSRSRRHSKTNSKP